ncbi:MAG: acetyltransferase, partial [Chloroflexi bacterium]|nr:acetyltransferase [Chloroflexota bacterium]
MTTPPAIVIVGAGDHGRVVLELLRAAGATVVGFVEPRSRPDRTSVDGAEVIGDLE